MLVVVIRVGVFVFPNSVSWKRNIKQINGFCRAHVCPKALLSWLPEKSLLGITVRTGSTPVFGFNSLLVQVSFSYCPSVAHMLLRMETLPY